MTLRTALRGARAYMQNSPTSIRVDILRMLQRTKNRALHATPRRLKAIIPRRRARVWIDGKKAFRRIRQLIELSEESIIIRMFIWKDDATGQSIRDVLLRAADRGVHISISKEASGDFFELHQSFLDTKNSSDPQWKVFWKHRNIVREHTATRDHSKIFIVDENIVLLTGMNIAEEYEYQWHDYMVELCGAHFVRDITAEKTTKNIRAKERIVVNMDNRMDVRSRLTEILRHAKRSITIEHCYFHDDAITRELIAKSKEGIRIVIIIPKRTDVGHNGNMETVQRLVTEGNQKNIHIMLYPTMFHAKLLVVDKKIAFLGSANLNTLSLDRTGEVCIELRGRTSAMRKIRRSIRRSIFRSHPMKKSSSSRATLVWILSMMGL